jgi:hypothetical protein
MKGHNYNTICRKCGKLHQHPKGGLKLKGYKQSPEHIHKRALARLGKKDPKSSIAHMGNKNPMWKGDKATTRAGQARAERLYKLPHGLERHHIDGNRLNNSPENIAFLSRKDHMITDGLISSRDAYGRFCGGL